MKWKREKRPVKFLSFGGGQDSTTILYKFILDEKFKSQLLPNHDLVVVMADTGDESPETYRHVRYIKDLCFKKGIEFYFLDKSMGYHSDAWQSLDHQLERNDTIIMLGTKSCTDNLKIKPIYRFINDYLYKRYLFELKNHKHGHKAIVEYSKVYEKLEVFVGIARGEEKRALKATKLLKTRPKWFRESVQISYPLLQIGFSRSDCQEYMNNSPYEICPPSACQKCPYKNKAELVYLYKTNPEIFNYWEKLEQKKLLKNSDKEKNHGVFGTKKTIREVLEVALEKYGDWPLEKLEEYNFSHGHCVKNAM
ncbi:MAG: hypothetical protein GY909_15985 [Oligoflexia bacterium]|nr:hypothetical protein [Oligoflexia bacterium]